MLGIYCAAPPTWADIFTWEWINPNDTSLGKRESATLAPDGAGLLAAPGLSAGGHDLTQAYLIGADLADAYFGFTTLTDADLSGANLRDVYFRSAELTNTNFTDADIRGAYFFPTTGIGLTTSQLYTTASYQTGDLTGTRLEKMDVTGGNFSEYNLHRTSFFLATLKNANLTDANLDSAHFGSADLTDADLGNANLANANFSDALLQDADLTGAEIGGANFSSTSDSGFSAVQLYSTASYQSGNLAGINFTDNALTALNFRDQNLAGADFIRSTLSNVDFTNANLTDASFYEATLTTGNFDNAIINGSSFNSTTTNGFTAEQLYSTASYQTKNLSDVELMDNELIGWDFGEQKLANATFYRSDLTGANFGSADLPDAGFNDANLLNANLEGANLTDASFSRAILNNANLANAKILEADFSWATSTGFSPQHLYSTSSYQQSDLSGVRFDRNTMSGWNFAGQALIDASFGNTTLVNADFSGADLTDTDFINATLDLADFTNATIRGASFRSLTSTSFTPELLYSTASYQKGDLAGIRFDYNNMAGWTFAGQTLTNASFYQVDLTGANLTSADLTNANFFSAAILDADFSNADIRGASFSDTALSAHQLESTASYQVGDLTGVGFGASDFTGMNFADQDLTLVSLGAATLTGADFTGSLIRGAKFNSLTPSGFTSAQLYSTASYHQGDLREVEFRSSNLTGWNFSNQNLAHADFFGATLANADFSGADVRGANFGWATEFGFTSSQLYSTASYQVGDLTGIQLGGLQGLRNDLSGWDFSGQRMTIANFRAAILQNVDFRGANLIGVSFDSSFGGSTIESSDFTGADARAATDLLSPYRGVVPTLLASHNFIYPDGHIEGLDILADEIMRLWDYNLENHIPIVVEEMMAVDDEGMLRAVFEDDDWGSTISFEAGISVSLDGTLELLFEDVDPTNLIGTTFQLFDWSGVTPVGIFDAIATQNGAVWDTSALYSSGHVTLVEVTPDFDLDGDIDGADWLAIQRMSPGLISDWQRQYGSGLDDLSTGRVVPEPNALGLVLLSLVLSPLLSSRFRDCAR